MKTYKSKPEQIFSKFISKFVPNLKTWNEFGKNLDMTTFLKLKNEKFALCKQRAVVFCVILNLEMSLERL